jgi:hypothetical protein
MKRRTTKENLADDARLLRHAEQRAAVLAGPHCSQSAKSTARPDTPYRAIRAIALAPSPRHEGAHRGEARPE